MMPHWLTVVIAFENLFVSLVYVGAFGRITWRNRDRIHILLGGIFTTLMFAMVDLTVLVVFLREGV